MLEIQSIGVLEIQSIGVLEIQSIGVLDSVHMGVDNQSIGVFDAHPFLGYIHYKPYVSFILAWNGVITLRTAGEQRTGWQ